MYSNHPVHGKYKANEKGEIIGASGLLLKPIIHNSGYAVLGVKGKQYRWHRFVWECFHGVIENKELVINHKDGNKLNNSIDNLELVTHSQNARHAYNMGLRVTIYGEESSSSKLSEKECTALILLIQSGYSNKELGEFFGIHPNYVSLIRHRKRWVNLWEKMEISAQ